MEELIIKERETKEDIIKIINNSGLPVIILKPIIKEVFEKLNILGEQEYQKALRYKQEMSKKIDLSKPTKGEKHEKN